MLAAKKSTDSSADADTDDEDVPLWDSAVKKNTEKEAVPPQVENVLSMIPGEIV
jgi:hypothetical protein